MRRVATIFLLLLAVPALAAAECSFDITGTIWTLSADCATDRSIVLPDGVTLDGAQHTILAVDPPSGVFLGGVIIASGGSATVINTRVAGLMLADVCQTGADRLRGIFFDGASGVIRGNAVVSINKGASPCQEGNGIEVRHSTTASTRLAVEIEGNVVDGFQKTGIAVSGNVDVTVRGNSVGESATQALLAANGIQVSGGAYALIEANVVNGNSWWSTAAAATAILLNGSAVGTVVRDNTIVGNADVGVYVQADGVTVTGNRLTDTGPDGGYDIGIGNYGADNAFSGNSIRGFAIRYQGVTERDAAGAGVVAALE